MKEKFKKLFKNPKINYILVGILGVIIGGGIFGTLGIVATTNRLEAKYVMYTKDGVTMTVQDAIKDLYILDKNGGGSVTNLTLTPEVSGSNISIAYTGTYTDVKCVYGTDEKYGSVGRLEENKCIISGMPNVTYYYKIITLNNVGEIYSGSGKSTTKAGATVVTSELPTGVKAIVYLDPTNLGTTCNASNSTVGSGTSGCMKWYVFREDTNSYTMILDHNTKSNVAWNSDNVNTSMKEVQAELNNLVSGAKWKVTPRLIKAQEIANITGNTSWTTSSTHDKWFYLDSNTQTQTATSMGASKYYWLFDYTKTCTGYGCNVADTNSNNWGYWTDTTVYGDGGRVWYLVYYGRLAYTSPRDTDLGVRPVITVSKSNI